MADLDRPEGDRRHHLVREALVWHRQVFTAARADELAEYVKDAASR
ncbi:MAG: hypothetical protein ACTHPS_08105 [Streptosporangiaceae bacterium]